MDSAVRSRHHRPVMDLSIYTTAGLLAVAFATGGAAWGVVADRIAARWPAHEGGGVRSPDWRTASVGLLGAAAFGGLPGRFSEPRDLILVGAWFAALILLAATDLDQRVLPDVITLPLAGAALLVLLAGWNPVLSAKGLGTASGIAAAIAAPVFLGVTGRLFRGALGMGDLKLAVSLGLAAGLTRTVAGFTGAALFFALVLLLLIGARRIGLRSIVPFGPALIVAGFIAVLLGPRW
jgi:leader peptidase (prepilin peptidase) / N-methyltransferase